MTMTENEIVRSYREAKNKRQQIEILADLNTTSIDEIKKILKANGVDLRGGNYRANKPAVINKEFDDAVQEMIEDIKTPEAPDPEEEKEFHPVPDCINWIIDLGMEQLTTQITEKEQQLKVLQDDLEDLKAKRVVILARMKKIYADNDGNLWYRNGVKGQTVIVEE